VRAIENDCALVPVGAFKLTPTHELRYNDSFRGVPLSEITNPASFQHFRGIDYFSFIKNKLIYLPILND